MTYYMYLEGKEYKLGKYLNKYEIKRLKNLMGNLTFSLMKLPLLDIVELPRYGWIIR